MSQIANGAWSNPHDRLGSLTCQIDSSVSSGTSKSASVWTPEDPSPRRQNETLSLGTEMKSGTMFDELSRANAMGMVSSLPLPADSKLLSRPVDVGQPQANINLEQIQAQAELLEAQSRSDHQQALHLTEQHFRQMCDSKGIRVTHACEHCRQRKAKVRRFMIFDLMSVGAS
ncbi:hypothetical protein BCV70DRAFT_111725 [Testicularia cyperi]|uniref:Uncharacterized protein n=1 Tax=Testicularia cyperi TaxID=1882483 RepID=A0A317XPE8_9BASI|nr:hypothetical protein BCV70DRAFT_111725 [Testicularia cyperi]